MSDVSSAFNHKAFIALLTIGDPTIEKSIEYAAALVQGGADLIVLGVPFSDPVADGPAIQTAHLRALASGASLNQVFDAAATLRKHVSVPLVFQTYLNPAFHLGYEQFFARCQGSGVAGVIIPDLPFEEQPELRGIASAHSVDVITAFAPTAAERAQRIAEQSRGFVCLVPSPGAPGGSKLLADAQSMTRSIKQHTNTPVVIGFGIDTPEQAAELAAVCDGVIIDSPIASIIAEHPDDAAPRLRDLVASIKQAIAVHCRDIPAKSA